MSIILVKIFSFQLFYNFSQTFIAPFISVHADNSANYSIDTRRSAPLAGHDHIRIVAPATRTDQSFTPIWNGRLGTVSLRHFGGIRLNLTATRLAPHDEANMGSRGVPEGHGWAEIGFHLTTPPPFG